MLIETLYPVQTSELEYQEAPLFEKRTIVELTDSDLTEVQGGTTPACAAAAASSGYCASAAVAVTIFVASAVVGYFSKKQ